MRTNWSSGSKFISCSVTTLMSHHFTICHSRANQSRVTDHLCISTIWPPPKWDGLTVGTIDIGSVLPGFIPSLPSQIWVSDVTFVTFFGDKKCHASHLSHFWEECDALAHENIVFNLWRFLTHPSRNMSHFGPAGTKLFLNGKKCDDSAGTETCFPLPVSDLSRKTSTRTSMGSWTSMGPRSHDDSNQIYQNWRFQYIQIFPGPISSFF